MNRFLITGLSAEESVTVSVDFPDAVAITAQYHKINSSGQWKEVNLGSNNGDNRITLVLTDGDPLTDAHGIANGIIDDPGALTSATGSTSSSCGGGGGCFITARSK